QRARRIEFENLRRRKAARALPWIERRTLFVGLQRVDAAVHHPDVILAVDGDTGHRPKDPGFFLWKRLWPERIDDDGRRRGFCLGGERHERGGARPRGRQE